MEERKKSRHAPKIIEILEEAKAQNGVELYVEVIQSIVTSLDKSTKEICP